MQETGSFRALRPKHRCVASVEKVSLNASLPMSASARVNRWYSRAATKYTRAELGGSKSSEDIIEIEINAIENARIEWRKGKKTKESVKGASDG